MRQGRHEALGRALLVAAAASAAGVAAYAGSRVLRARRKRASAVNFDYSDRSGFPRPPEEMRGIARDRGQSPIFSKPATERVL